MDAPTDIVLEGKAIALAILVVGMIAVAAASVVGWRLIALA